MARWRNVLMVFFCVSVCPQALTLSYAQDEAALQENDNALSNFESRINALIEENIVLKKKLKDFNSGFSSVPRAGSSDTDMKNQKLQEEKTSLAAELEKKDKEIVLLQKQLADFKKNNQNTWSALEGKLKSLEEEVQFLRAQREESNKENNDLRGQVEKAKSEIAAAGDVQEALNKLQEENKQLLDKAAALQQESSAQALERTMLEAMLRRHPQDLKPPLLARSDEGNFDKMIHVNLGFAYAIKENIDEAVREYRQALSADPEDADIHYNLGYLLNKQNNYSEAIKEYSQALKGVPQDREIYYNVALIYALGLKDVKTAEEYHQKFLSLASVDTGSLSPVEEAAKAK